ncbi:transcriptional regulator [Lentzea sp. NBRC 105346]|uniref:AraC family transcriptional regulator n=1 Tax=Lentzea sp. NBRC 105346 TaxID=3032205 RepID=UPI0024A24F7B|nr:AraC family transcriptional regulator [Lentzea sp. NBRC 105346]GLZ28690.1 transcriptional regulator [Lentzea sp. NBRC 105346]
MCASCRNGRPVDVSGQHPRGLAGVRAMLEVGAEHGVPRETLLRDTGIAPGTDEVCGEQELRVAANLVAAIGPAPGLGLAVGQRVGLRAYGVWGFALLTSATLGHASDFGLRYLPLTYAMTGLRLQVTTHEVRLIIEDAPPFIVEREIATVTGIVRAILGSQPRTMHVELRLPHADYESVLQTPVSFGKPHNALVADVAVLDQPLPQADPVTTAACEQACRTLVQQRSPGSTARIVRRIVAEGVTDADAIAARMHLSARTLRRQLAAEHTSVRRLVEETRRASAFALLANGHTVEHVGARLGYTDAATFIRAFRRWTGTTPGTYRR